MWLADPAGTSSQSRPVSDHARRRRHRRGDDPVDGQEWFADEPDAEPSMVDEPFATGDKRVLFGRAECRRHANEEHDTATGEALGDDASESDGADLRWEPPCRLPYAGQRQNGEIHEKRA